METDEVVRRRLAGLGLASAPGVIDGAGALGAFGAFGDPVDVVRRLGAVQAQDYGPALWSLGRRTGLLEAVVEQPLRAGALLRTHVLRPTWHLVPAEELLRLQDLTKDRVHALNAHYYRRNGLDEATFRRSDRVVEAAVGEAGELTREALRAALVAAGLDVGDLRATLMVMHAELEGIVCSGVRQGRRQTFALVADRVADSLPLDRDAALADLTRRYFSSHGPASVKDFGWWSSLRRANLERGLALAGERLRRDEVDGIAVWSAADAPQVVDAGDGPAVRLVQAYDEYVVGYSETKYLLDRAGLARGRPGGAAVFNQHLLVDGQVTGCWRRATTARAVTVEVTPDRPLTPAEHAGLEVEAQACAGFLGRTLDLRVSEPVR